MSLRSDFCYFDYSFGQISQYVPSSSLRELSLSRRLVPIFSSTQLSCPVMASRAWNKHHVPTSIPFRIGLLNTLLFSISRARHCRSDDHQPNSGITIEH